MTLRSALSDVAENESHPTRFPGERRTTEGLFSGLDDRLVHVAPDGSLRDFTDSISPLSGLDRAVFGLQRDGEVTWFDEFDRVSQGYAGDTALVETRLEAGSTSIVQSDLTVGRTHLTHVECEGIDDAELRVLASFVPDGRESRVGRLVHEDATEVYHRIEHDYLAGANATYRGRPPATFESIRAGEDERLGEDRGRTEDRRLGGTATAAVPLAGGATVATLLTDRTETLREEALDSVGAFVSAHDDREALVRAARRQATERLPDTEGKPATVAADLRTLGLLSAPTGARIAGPEFDPFFAHSGGYGYTWFRDDSEVSGFLFEAERDLGIDLSDRHGASAAFYCETQREDGTWPHRVWAHDGSLAPGWANGRLEAGEDVSYQADQTGSVAAFLARYLREGEVSPGLAVDIRETLGRALDGLDDTLAADGLPEPCENAWENMHGRFANTAATFLGAYAELASAPLDAERANHAAAQADRVYESLDRLWMPDRDAYALRLREDERDERLDSSTFALVAAHESYVGVGDVDGERLDRLESHVETLCEGLYRDPGPVEGLFRFEGDDWRTRGQDDEKVWTVSTAWGAHAAAVLADLLEEHGRTGDRAAGRSRALLALLEPEGPLCFDGYLPEQVFDDGTPDCATPLGWPHAIRLATVGRLRARERRE